MESLTCLHSPRILEGESDHAADAEAKVYSCSDDGETKVVLDAAVQPPALPDLLHPEQQQPAYDEEHANPDDELRTVYGHIEEKEPFLLR